MARDAASTDIRDPKEGLFVDFLTIEELYAGPYTFELPWFQRAYAWTEDLAKRLLGDIHQAYQAGANRYFIGHVMLARRSGETGHVLVDGQQRAVTLMILFAILRRKLAGTEKGARLVPLIEAGAGADGPTYRLTPQPTLSKFFQRHVQSPDAFTAPIDEFGSSEAERNVLNNRTVLEETVNELAENGCNLEEFTEFLLTRCLLVLEIIDNEQNNEAWEMLQLEENTGLPFHDAARTKITLIETMPPEHRDEASQLWDQCQSELGNDGMQQLIRHIRDLSGRMRSSQPVEKDVATRFSLYQYGLNFVHEVLVPSAERLTAIRQHRVGSGESSAAITASIRHMELTGLPYWCIAGMRWLEQHGDGHQDTAEFFQLLSRKTWLLRISGADKVEHERRFIALSNQIEDGLRLNQMSELKVQKRMATKVRENLLSRTFYAKGYSRPVLRLLSDLLGDDPETVEASNVTVEHVLPKSPNAQSEWANAFGNPKAYAHRLGNMALLTFQENQAVGNSEYQDKRKILAKSRFVLSRDAAQAGAWTPAHVLARSDALVGVMFDHWQIKP